MNGTRRQPRRVRAIAMRRPLPGMWTGGAALWAAATLLLWAGSARAQDAAAAESRIAAPPLPERPVRSEADASPTLTLEQALTRAQQVAASVVQAEGSVEVARATRKAAVGAFLPSLSANAGVNFSSSARFDPNTNITVSGAATSVSAGLSASWDVFNGFRRMADLKIADAGNVTARADLEGQRRNVIYDTTVAYYEALRAGQVLEVAVSRIQRAEVGLMAADRRHGVGAATRSDLLRARLELNAAKTAELEARTQRRAAELELGRLVGAEGPMRPLPGARDSQAPVVSQRAELVDEILSSHPTLTAQRASVNQADASLDGAYGAYWPSLRLSAGTDWFGRQPDFFPGQDSWSVRLGLSIPLFDGFARDVNTQRAKVQTRTSRAQLAEAERSVRTQVERALDQLELASERVALSREAVVSAEEDLRVQQERYDLGVSTMLELLTSQEALVAAENEEVAALFNQDLARAQLEALSGRTR